MFTPNSKLISLLVEKEFMENEKNIAAENSSLLTLEFPKNAFRFRPLNQVTLKEILYGEVYFSTKGELNDPYDTKSNAYYTNDNEILQRLIYHFISPNGEKDNMDGLINVPLISEFLSGEDLIYDELIEKINTKGFEEIWLRAFNRELLDIAPILLEKFRTGLLNSDGGYCYIISFAKKFDEPLMWSHYANNHHGFCLCFTLKENKIYRNDQDKHDRLYNEYLLEEVTYDSESTVINGFYRFPAVVLGNDISDDEKRKYWADRKKSYLSKYSGWKYENEVRAIHGDWFAHKIKWPSTERIFHYDPAFLTGIILGANLNENERNEIRHAVIYYRNNAIKNGKLLNFFTFYEAKICLHFKIKIDIVDGWSLDPFNKGYSQKDYEKKVLEFQRFQEWNDSQSFS